MNWTKVFMERQSMFRGLAVGLVLMCVCLRSGAQTEIPLRPFLNYTNGFTQSANNLLEIGLIRPLGDVASSSKLKGGVRVPTTKDDKNRSQIDRHTDNYNLFLSGDLVLRNKAGDGQAGTASHYLTIEPGIEWATKEFTYTPDTISDHPVSTWKQSIAFELKGRYFTAAARSGAWQWGVYGRARYAETAKEASSVSIMNKNNRVVKDYILAGPSIIRALSPALGVQAYPGTKSPFAYAVLFYYYWTDEDKKAGYEKERFRSEQWFYYYPVTEKVAGLRIGFGVFEDHYTKGKKADRFLWGGLVSVKVDTNILQSIL